MIYDNFKIYDSTDVAMEKALIKRGSKMTFERKILISDFINEFSKY